MDDNNFLNDKQNQRSFKLIAVGGIILAVLLIFIGIWANRSAQRDTEETVHSVSRFYLKDLSGHCKHLVESSLATVTANFKNALKSADLQTQDALQNWLARMEFILNVNEIVLLDSDGNAYTARGNVSIDKNDKSAVKVDVDAVPFMNTQIVGALIRVNFENILNKNHMHENGERVVCNQKFSNTANLFDELKNFKFSEGYNVEAVRADFLDDKGGFAFFTIDGNGEELLFYNPVEGAEWMLICLNSEDTIVEQISAVSDKIINRSIIQMLLTIAIMAVICGVVLQQAKRTAQIIHEKEISDTKNEIQRVEMEEKLALQNKILDDERRRRNQDEMIRALSSDYRTVYHYNLDTDEGICYRSTEGVSSYEEGDTLNFSEFIKNYIENIVIESDKSDVSNFMTPSNLRERLKTENLISKRYLANRDGKDYYMVIRVARIDDYTRDNG